MNYTLCDIKPKYSNQTILNEMSGWQNKPFVIQAKAGETIAFCMCGNSKTGPTCDGTHKGSGISPKVITYDKDTEVHACGCVQSKNKPMCDGTHKTITE